LVSLFAGVVALGFTCDVANAEPSVRIEFLGSAEEVVRWQEDRCEDIDMPDTALRIFRRYDDKIIGVASHYVTYALIGSNLTQMKKNGCHVAFRSPKNPDPAQYNDQTWLAATWTDDGKSIAAIGHHEYHGELHPGMCAGKTPRECRYGVLSLLGSKDGGDTFTHVNLRPIAAVDVPQRFDQGKDIGFFQPSNIMEWEGLKYVFVRTSGGGKQLPAACLMRAKNPLEPESWEIYDGKGFRRSLFDPYKDEAAKDPVCAQIPGLNGMVWGLLRHRQRGVFIAILVVNEPGTKTLRLATSVSTDLLNWPKPLFVDGIKFEWSGECSDGPVYHYPSLIDPDAPGRNFDTTGDDALLFLTVIHRKDCKMGMNRDLVFRRVHLQFE
jgi:hypothetical protein